MRYLVMSSCCFFGILSTFICEKILINDRKKEIQRQKEIENRRKSFRLVKNIKY